MQRGSRLVHGGAGHAPHWEDPARVAADIAAFNTEIAALA
jgi:pimeloyl-ACP methyl ester carboxylesterase